MPTKITTLMREQTLEKRNCLIYGIWEANVENILDRSKEDTSLDESIQLKHKEILFIESLLLGLPLCPLCIWVDKNEEWTIVDGKKRIRAINRYAHDELCLDGLKLLSTYNESFFSDLLPLQQRSFLKITFRVIVLHESVTKRSRNYISDLLNGFRGSNAEIS